MTNDHRQTELLEAYRRAASYSSGSRFNRFIHAPFRTAAIKAANLVATRVDLGLPLRTGTFWGEEIKVRVPEAISDQLVCCGLFEAGLTFFMLELVEPGDSFIDVGAHLGYFTLLAAHLVGDTGEVHAFEPTPSTFRQLSENVGSRANVKLNAIAVWSEPCRLTITDFGVRLSAFNSAFAPRLKKRRSGRAMRRPIEVRAIALDDYCSERDVRPHFVKIDAESAEYQILGGMRRLLQEQRPLITLEVGDFAIDGVPPSAVLLESVLSDGYTTFEFSDGTIQPHQMRESYQYENILLVPKEHRLAQAFSPSFPSGR